MHSKRGALPLAAFVALLVAMVAGLAAPSVGYADEISDPATTDYTTLGSQSENEGYIAQYPELAYKIITSLAKREELTIDGPSENITGLDLHYLLNEILKHHPEFFDVANSLKGSAETGYTITYLLTNKTNDEIFDMRQKLARGIAHAMSWIPANGTDLEKVKAAHDWLVAHVEYDHSTFNSNPWGNWSDAVGTVYGTVLNTHDTFYPYCAYGPLAEHSGVCQGTSYAFKLLMDKCGIPCVYVSNTTQNHGWNHVQIDGAWYNVDATWDGNGSRVPIENLLYYKGGESLTYDYWKYWEHKFIGYDYFLKSDNKIASIDAARGATAHNDYNKAGVYDNATDEIYDEYDDENWEAQSPQPDATYFHHSKTQVESFELSKPSVSLTIGETAQLAVQNIIPASVNPLASRWTSSNEDVACVCADGTIMAVGEGTATVTCTMGDADLACKADRADEVTQTCEVTVSNNTPAASPTFTSAQLLLGEQIKMQYWLTAPKDLDLKGSSAEFTIGGKNARSQTISIADATYEEAKNRYGFAFELSSVEMAEPITCTFTYGESETATKTYSVKDYVLAALEQDLTNVEKACIRAIANYGHYMQPYLSASGKWTIGEDYEEMDTFYADDNDVDTAKNYVEAFKPVKSGDGVSDVNITCSLALGSYTTFDLFITPKGDDAFNATATFNGETYTATKVGGRYRIRVNRIKAGQLGNKVSVSGTVGDKTFSLGTYPLSYAYMVLYSEPASGEVAQDAMTSIYNYYSTATALKATQQ